jgi:hypothetical protein
MNIHVVVVNVEGLTNQVETRMSKEQAIDLAVELASDQCDSPKDIIRAELVSNGGFTAPNGDVTVTIHECDPPMLSRQEKVRYSWDHLAAEIASMPPELRAQPVRVMEPYDEPACLEPSGIDVCKENVEVDGEVVLKEGEVYLTT